MLILNNDAVAEPGLAEALERAIAQRPDAGLLACKIVGEDGTVQYGGAKYRRWIGYSGRAEVRSPDVEPGTLLDVDRADGAASVVSRAAAETAGLLDESLFLYVEDVDWSLRIRRAGFAVVYVSDALVRHKGSAASGGRRSTMNLYYDTRNTIVVLEKHARLPRGLKALRRGVVVAAHVGQTIGHPARRDALRAVLDGWRDARAGKLGQRSSPQTVSVSRAVRSHEKSSARASPRSTHGAGSASTSSTASAIARGSRGSKSRAASPTVSGSAATFEHATGQPHAIASSGGRPKPS
jgi:hypothetical protein